MLKETLITGEVLDKRKQAIDRLRAFEPKDGYYLAYSGGKDSDCILELAKEAGVRFDAHYNVTTIDPPELVRYAIRRFDAVVYHRPNGDETWYSVCRTGKMLRPMDGTLNDYTRVLHFELPSIPMRKLIPKKLMPPTQIQRYCCAELKENNGKNRVVVTGVRWAESVRRAKNQGLVTIIDNGKLKDAEHGRRVLSGGIVLNDDNDKSRRMVEQCFRTHKTMVNPIIDWADEDVWEYLRQRGVDGCELYRQGFHRLGCVACPMSGSNGMHMELEKYPQFKRFYLDCFKDMIDVRKSKGKEWVGNRKYSTEQDIFAWWIGDAQIDKQIDGQIEMELEGGVSDENA